MNAYELLGIDRLADLDAIKQAYRSLAKALHPDVNTGDEEAADRFKHITAAYNLLADKKKRAEYDRNAGRKGGPPGHGAPWEKGGVWYDFEIDETSGERISDLYGDVAGTRLGRVKGAAATSMKVKGQDVAAKLKITENRSQRRHLQAPHHHDRAHRCSRCPRRSYQRQGYHNPRLRDRRVWWCRTGRPQRYC